MAHLIWADSDAERMFIEAALDVPDRPSVEFVTDGEALLDRCAAVRPDLIVLDLDLPRVSGLDVLAELQTGGNRVPVVVFSKAASPTIDACYRLGATRVIVKPQDFREFHERVHQVLAVQATPGRRASADPAAMVG